MWAAGILTIPSVRIFIWIMLSSKGAEEYWSIQQAAIRPTKRKDPFIRILLMGLHPLITVLTGQETRMTDTPMML
ncbi:hypothetical protein D3C81_2127190 [compost metagenome]